MRVRRLPMIELREALEPYLVSLHPRVHFQIAPDDSVFPYVTYDLQIYDDGEGAQIVNLDIDGWDNTPDTTALENMMKSINNIDKHVITTDTITVVFYLENKIPLVDDDKSIKRRKYSYVGHLYEGS